MTSQSMSNYVNVSVVLSGTGPQPAGFGVPMLLHTEEVIGAPDRLHGPFTSAQDVLDYGYASGSAPHAFAQALMSQQPRVSQFYIGHRFSADADVGASLEAVLAEDPAAWYCVMMASRSDADILELAATVEGLSYPKVALAQSSAASLLAGTGRSYTATVGGTATDGVYRLTFTGYGLGAPVNVDVTRSTTPATNDDLAAAIDAALVAAAAGSLSGVLTAANVNSALSVVSFTLDDGIDAGTITASAPAPGTLTVATTDEDVGSVLFDNGYLRTALVYHPTDADYLDARWASRCLAYDLDTKKGNWAYKQIAGVDGTNLTNAQVSALRAVNANYFAPAVSNAGVTAQAFTAQGWFPGGTAGAGRRIDVTISLDWLNARLQESIFDVLLRAPNGVPYTDVGINMIASAVRSVLATGVAAGHLVEFVVPDGEAYAGTATPAVFAPKLAEISATTRTLRTVNISALAYLRSSIEKVNFTIEVRQ